MILERNRVTFLAFTSIYRFLRVSYDFRGVSVASINWSQVKLCLYSPNASITTFWHPIIFAEYCLNYYVLFVFSLIFNLLSSLVVYPFGNTFDNRIC